MKTNRIIAVGQASRLSPSSRKLETGWKPVLLCLALLSTLNSQLSTAFAQGSLTPPGAPAPTMKSADQIYSKLDPRTPISSAPFIITNSGSYYLTTNLTVSSGDGIDINTNGVTLDLMGFTISSTTANPPSGTGILLNSGLSDITILNGHIRGGVTNNGSGVFSGSGFGNGIYYSYNPPRNVVISKVSVAGVLGEGINVVGGGNSQWPPLRSGFATVVEDCTVTTAGGGGISASTIKSSAAIGCGGMYGGSAILGDQVSDCRGICISKGPYDCGIFASASAQNCYGQSSNSCGIYASGTAQNCYGQSSGTGLFAANAIGCSGSSSTGTGLNAYNASFCTGDRPGGTAIQAGVATGCYSINGTNIIAYKYNMP